MSPTPNKPDADQSAEEKVDNRPPIAKFFERLGLGKGSKFKAVLLVGGEELRQVEVADVVFCGDPVECVVVMTESGRADRQLIQWKHIVAIKV